MNAQDAQRLEAMIADIQQTETLLLKRSRENLDILKKVLEGQDEVKRVPAVLSAFSIAGIIAGLFINAGINSGRLLAYHSETLTIYLRQALEGSPERMLALSSLRYKEAGLHFPWLDGKIASIQTRLEQFQEIQVRGISPLLAFINKITEITRALSEAPEGISLALRTYVSEPKEQLFIWAVVEELATCIHKYPQSLESLHKAQASAEGQMTSFMKEMAAFIDDEQQPEATVLFTTDTRSADSSLKFTARTMEQVDLIEQARKTTERFDKSLQLMAKTLPPFIRTLSSLTIAWNKETRV